MHKNTVFQRRWASNTTFNMLVHFLLYIFFLVRTDVIWTWQHRLSRSVLTEKNAQIFQMHSSAMTSIRVKVDKSKNLTEFTTLHRGWDWTFLPDLQTLVYVLRLRNTMSCDLKTSSYGLCYLARRWNQNADRSHPCCWPAVFCTSWQTDGCWRSMLRRNLWQTERQS